MFDTVIKNGTVVDGSGKRGYPADVAIEDGRIAAIGNIDEGSADTIDASGKVICPGFIDPHTHYDAQVFWDNALSPSCYHGITTAVGGFCGFSIAPLSPEAAPYLLAMLARVEGMPVSSLREGVPWDWQSFSQYLAKLEGNVGINVGFMAGHSAIRRVVMGERAVGHEASPHELAEMTKLLARCLSEGALGFSSTVATTHSDADGNPVPSRHARRDEFIALARVVRDFPGTSLEFLPGVGRLSDETIELLVDLSTTSARPVNWNSLTVDDEEVSRNQLSATDAARAAGGEVIALVSSGTGSMRLNLHSGVVFDSLDGWEDVFKLPTAQRIRLFQDPEKRKELERRALNNLPAPFAGVVRWQDYTVCNVFKPENKKFEGRTVGDIAKEAGTSPFDTFLDIAIADDLRTSFMRGNGKNRQPEAAIWKRRATAWLDDRTVIGASDAGAHLDMIDTFSIPTQILAHGVRKHGVISLEDAVHQLTDRSARLFGLKQRGLLMQGWHADITIFDPDTVGAGASYLKSDLPAGESRVYADAIGVDHVLVNGVQIIDNGSHTGRLPGTVLRSGKDTITPTVPLACSTVRHRP